MKSLWIANTPLGIKRIVIFYAGIFLCVAWFPLPGLTVFTTSVLLLFVIAYRNGVVVRNDQIVIAKESYEILSFYDLRSPNTSYREMVHKPTNIAVSKVCLCHSASWIYLDCVRILFQKQPRMSLLLGGGGGAMAVQLSRSAPGVRVDVVEHSHAMIQIAKKYFFPLAPLTRDINVFHADAFRFVYRGVSQYDFIFVDLFQGDQVRQHILKPSFITRLRTLLKTHGVLVVNFGFLYRHPNIPDITKIYRKTFPSFHLFFSHGNIIGTNARAASIDSLYKLT